jgi:predicted ATPase
MSKPHSQARIEHLSIRNYRALQHVQLHDLKAFTVLVGPNGSGKSTVLDALSFVSECFRVGLPRAWMDRGSGQELKTRGQNDPIGISIGYREQPDGELITYLLEIDEEDGRPVVTNERVTAEHRRAGETETILEHIKVPGEDEGEVIRKNNAPGSNERTILIGADLIAANVLGQLQDNPILVGLRRFIHDWQKVDLSIASLRAEMSRSRQHELSESGDNLANVIHYLGGHDPERLDQVFRVLASRVPQAEKALAEEMADGRLVLRIKDAAFRETILARFASDGTLKMLAFLILLHQAKAPRFISIEEPENYLHPRLMYPLAEEFRNASGQSQLLLTTHSPYFVDALRPDEVRILYRDENGYTQAVRASDIDDVREFMADGALLGDLWMEGRFHVGDPLTNFGLPVRRAGS